MAKTSSDRLSAIIEEVEKRAKKLRADLRKRVTQAGLPTSLDAAAKQLRKRAAAAAEQVEKYVHQIVKDLEGEKKPARRPKAKRKGGGPTRAQRPAAPAE